ncbi:HNH endonuclease [Paenibacillus lautus]|uniref:HNH endonuclease n=1 Tax=Paenibacillus lautus TaxID=1401 RepID=UPI002DBCF970|nr:HNH endonuclease [Paenibacillus lautus]MEC0311367.1 HNH endonuclease [Paenibacillus lautus]
MNYLSIFQMPKPVNVSGRISSITNSFVNGIIPCISPTENEIKECLQMLGLDPLDLRCSYCNDKSTEWDHFRPLIMNKKPTGYISDIYNLVPSCGKCNQSKGNRPWKSWIISSAKLSPKSRGIQNIEERIKKLQFEYWKEVKPIKFEELVDKELWEKHWDNNKRLNELMKESQEISNKIQIQLKERYNSIVARGRQ